MPFTLDESRWPIATLTIVDSVTHDEEDAIADGSSGLSLKGEPYAVIVDLLKAGTPSPRFIRVQAAAQRRRFQEIADHCAGIAFVINSPMLRGALRAILYMQSLPCPQTVVKTMAEAEAWTSASLE
jgi:hypothetical protein